MEPVSLNMCLSHLSTMTSRKPESPLAFTLPIYSDLGSFEGDLHLRLQKKEELNRHHHPSSVLQGDREGQWTPWLTFVWKPRCKRQVVLAWVAVQATGTNRILLRLLSSTQTE